MLIGYIANHDSGGNDDEGAITFALESLGHRVNRLDEKRGHAAKKLDCDLLLFHKWHDVQALRQVKVPKAFWYFDLVNWPNDPTLAGRNATRMAWMREIVPLVDLGFCTDGDWVAQDRSCKLVWLPQGADERVMGLGKWSDGKPPILLTGIRQGGGRGRIDFVDWMNANYGESFNHVSKGVHGRDLADLIASSRIVVAPDSPVTDNYWSNRVYNALGFGAFLLHPYCKTLASHYEDRHEIVFYRNRSELRELIAHYYNNDIDMVEIGKLGFLRTRQQHTYRHRCERLIEVVRGRLGV